MGPLTLQNCPPPSHIPALPDFLIVCIDLAKNESLCMPESFSGPSVCSQEVAACLKIHGAHHLRCAPGWHCNDIICLVICSPNSSRVCGYKQQFLMDRTLLYINLGDFMKQLLQVKECFCSYYLEKCCESLAQPYLNRPHVLATDLSAATTFPP